MQFYLPQSHVNPHTLNCMIMLQNKHTAGVWNMAPLIDKTGAPCVTVLPARGAMFAFRLRREKTEDTAVSHSRQ